MPDRERAIVIFSKDGKRVLFTSPHCRISDNPDGSFTITDLSLDSPPQWVRCAEANSELAKREIKLASEAGKVAAEAFMETFTGIKRQVRNFEGNFVGDIFDA